MSMPPSPAAAPGEVRCVIGSDRALVRLRTKGMPRLAMERTPDGLSNGALRTRSSVVAGLALVAVLAPGAVHADGEPADSSGGSASPPSPMEQRAWASDHIGSWTLGDGSVVFSTGRPQRDGTGFDPTLPQSAPQYPLAIMPYIGDDPWPPRRR